MVKPVLASACPRKKTANQQVGRILPLEYEFPSRSPRPSPMRKHAETPILVGESLVKKADADSPRPADNVSYDPQSSAGIGNRLGQIVQPADHSRTPVGQWQLVCHRIIATRSRILRLAERSVPLAQRHLEAVVARTTEEVSPPDWSRDLCEILPRHEPAHNYSASAGEQCRFLTRLHRTSGGRARLEPESVEDDPIGPIPCFHTDLGREIAFPEDHTVHEPA